MPQASNTAASTVARSSEARIKKLEQQLSVVTAERNDLAADVEALCMQSSGDIFSASSVLGDRISHIQKEANKLQCQVHPMGAMTRPALFPAAFSSDGGFPETWEQHGCVIAVLLGAVAGHCTGMSLSLAQLDAVTAERNSLHEDLINHRDSKRTVDKQWRLERERCERLESELAFYQNHSAQALSDRDKVRRAGSQIPAIRPDI